MPIDNPNSINAIESAPSAPNLLPEEWAPPTQAISAGSQNSQMKEASNLNNKVEELKEGGRAKDKQTESLNSRMIEEFLSNDNNNSLKKKPIKPSESYGRGESQGNSETAPDNPEINSYGRGQSQGDSETAPDNPEINSYGHGQSQGDSETAPDNPEINRMGGKPEIHGMPGKPPNRMESKPEINGLPEINSLEDKPELNPSGDGTSIGKPPRQGELNRQLPDLEHPRYGRREPFGLPNNGEGRRTLQREGYLKPGSRFGPRLGHFKSNGDLSPEK